VPESVSESYIKIGAGFRPSVHLNILPPMIKTQISLFISEYLSRELGPLTWKSVILLENSPSQGTVNKFLILIVLCAPL